MRDQGVLLRVWLLALALSASLAAHAQRLPQPSPPGGDASAAAELATSSWTRAQLDAWWGALRRHAVTGGAKLDVPAELLPPEADAAWRAQRLPDVRKRPGAALISDAGGYEMRWYRLHVPSGGEAMALYMPRLVTLSAAVLVRTPDGWQPLLDNQHVEREQWAQPLWLPLPGAGAQGLDLVVALPVPTGSYHAVSRIFVGPRDVLEKRWQWRVRMQNVLPQAVSLTLAVLGLFALLLWLRRPDEAIYSLFGLGALAWFVRNLHYYVNLPASPWAQDWFWWLTHASLAWVMLTALLYTLRFARRRYRRLELALMACVALVSVLSMPLWLRRLDMVVLQYAVTAAVAAVGTGFVCWLAWRERRTELRLMALALVVGLAIGAHDLALLAGWAWPEHVSLMPLATLIVMLSFLYAVQRRYVGTVEQVKAENSQLQEDLDEQVSVLQMQNAQLREAERQQALLLERQRIMADMHDGLGSSLLSALVAVEQGSMSHEKVVEVLRECVDDLRLVIDSIEPVGHDLVSLLATMRYRLGKRLQTGGLKLEWDVQDLPPLPWLEPPDALHVLRLMQEALNNVLKHASASRVRMVTRHHGSYVEIRVEDDGAGFDLQNIQHGRGLKSQIKRAQRLGGKLRIDSQPGVGTRLSLRLPVERKVQG
ncbi:ATP-binding protein [Roseateles asaccharophilus]|uniref:histidine kinase n=1 Tax=Roseateles asaccharophilus TaxID=582607 RepID=A0ABU2A187_9BURK|nr:ATP-binding protein [Roseateles asaccharophilus]MDR7330945.1 signal transduction histidine kinase [Roseateles asaccharophilus]